MASTTGIDCKALKRIWHSVCLNAGEAKALCFRNIMLLSIIHLSIQCQRDHPFERYLCVLLLNAIQFAEGSSHKYANLANKLKKNHEKVVKMVINLSTNNFNA